MAALLSSVQGHGDPDERGERELQEQGVGLRLWGSRRVAGKRRISRRWVKRGGYVPLKPHHGSENKAENRSLC